MTPILMHCVALPNLTEHFYNVQNEECGQKRNCPNDCVALPNLTEHFFNVQNEECGRKRNCPPILMPCVALPNITEHSFIVQNEECGQNKIVLHDPNSNALLGGLPNLLQFCIGGFLQS